MNTTCSTKGIEIDTPCSPPQTVEDRIEEQKRAIESVMTIFEHCPDCNKPGYEVDIKPVITLYPRGVCRISALNFKITRPCGHAARDFSIGY